MKAWILVWCSLVLAACTLCVQKARLWENNWPNIDDFDSSPKIWLSCFVEGFLAGEPFVFCTAAKWGVVSGPECPDSTVGKVLGSCRVSALDKSREVHCASALLRFPAEPRLEFQTR